VRHHVDMIATQNTEVMLGIFDAIERREDRRFTEYLDPQCEFHWPPSLPYGGVEGPFNPAGPKWRAREHFDGEAVGIYQLRDGKLLRAQMFYFDTSAVDRFLRQSSA
jgi:hypothetical protein